MQLEYIITRAHLVIGMDWSLIRHEILLAETHGTKKTWIQVVINKVMLDHTPLLDFWKDSKVKMKKDVI